jgi:hypothetical protein
MVVVKAVTPVVHVAVHRAQINIEVAVMPLYER